MIIALGILPGGVKPRHGIEEEVEEVGGVEEGVEGDWYVDKRVSNVEACREGVGVDDEMEVEVEEEGLDSRITDNVVIVGSDDAEYEDDDEEEEGREGEGVTGRV